MGRSTKGNEGRIKRMDMEGINIVMELCMKDSDWRICSMGREWKNGRMGRIIKESINMG